MVELRERGEEIRYRLMDQGLYKPIGEHSASLEDGRITYGEGYPITAIEKFLGYFDRQMNIANFPSISFNTDFSIARTACMYESEPGNDSVVLDGEDDAKYRDRAGKAANYFKSVYGIKGSFRFYIKREKRYSEAKGLGESAAVAASAARAITANVFGNEGVEDDPFVSRLARLVSGSGTRSVTGGFSMWVSYPWITDEQCHGARLPVDDSRFHIMAYPAMHEIKTEGAHDIAVSSPYYPRWMINKFQRVVDLMDSDYNIREMMIHAEEDMYLMHAVLMARGTVIHTPGSLSIINALRKFRNENEGIYYTSDTGPTLVLMAEDRKLLEEFSELVQEKPLHGKVVSSYSTSPDGKFMKEAEEYFSHK